MRSLNEYFVFPYQTVPNIQDANSGAVSCIPERGILHAIAVNVVGVGGVTAPTSFAIFLNGDGDTGVEVVVPIQDNAAGLGVPIVVYPNAVLNVAGGDRIFLTSGAQTGGSLTASFCYIIRR